MKPAKPSPLEYIRGPMLLITMMIGGTITFIFNAVLYPLFYLMDPMLRPAHSLLAFCVKLMMLPFFDVTIIGAENLDQNAVPSAVMVSNHQSAVDSLIFGYLWYHNFRASFKQDLMYVPGIGISMWIAGYVPVKRGDKASGQKFLERCAHLLRNNVWVLIFPEGTRKIDGSTGPLGPFKAGAFKLALDCDVPIVPITISGARHLMPARGFPFLRFGKCKLIIHKPVPTRGKSVEDLMATCREVITTGLEPCDELAPRVGVPPSPAVGTDPTGDAAGAKKTKAA